MTLHIQGLIAIPEEPMLEVIKPATSAGFFINFRAASQGKVGNKTEYQYWNCSLWVPETDKDKWIELISPGTVFYIEHAEAISVTSSNTKFTNTKLKLEFNKLKRLSVPLWFEEASKENV